MAHMTVSGPWSISVSLDQGQTWTVIAQSIEGAPNIEMARRIMEENDITPDNPLYAELEGILRAKGWID